MILVDGHYYDKESDVPDLGGLTYDNHIGGVRSYGGSNASFGKLPKYDDLDSCSTATLTDAGGLHVYFYDKETTTWVSA